MRSGINRENHNKINNDVIIVRVVSPCRSLCAYTCY